MRVTGSEPRLKQPALALGAGLLAVALVVAASFSRAWDAVEWKVFDFYTSIAAAGRSDLPIVILAIDEPSFQELRLQWPFPRGLHGQLLERVRADGAAGVAFDIVFAEPSDPAQDAAFADAIRRSGRVVLASAQERIENANAALWTQVPPLDLFLAAGAVAGDISVQPDDDYVVRRQANADDSLSAQLARYATTAPKPRSRQPALIEYLGPRGTIDTRSYYQALEPGLLPPAFFRGKLVLVGRSSRSAVELQTARADTFNSPFAVAGGGDRLFPGVEIQATLLANRLAGGGLHVVDGGWAYGLIAFFGALLVVAGRRLHPGATAAVAAGSAVAVLALSYTLFAWQKLWLAPLLPVAALAALYGATTAVSLANARRRALRMRNMFAQYVPAEVVARLVRRPELLRLGGEAREVTLMFTDLANFTGLSEKLTPEQTVEVLTAYFDAMTPIIHAHRGTVDKYIGDAIMAFWGAPLDDADHAEHAVRAALEMQRAMDRLRAGLLARGLPPIGMRIGIHSGTAVIGNVGSQARFSYTAIGDAVNLAARLEGANKAFGSGILLSDATAARLPHDIGLRPLDDVIVKGKTEPVRVYTPCDDAVLRDTSAQALAAFQARQWDEARRLLRSVLAANPADMAAERLLQRVDAASTQALDANWTATVALEKL
jgi:adenylate cyclase